jgi:hypothetical protein
LLKLADEIQVACLVGVFVENGSITRSPPMFRFTNPKQIGMVFLIIRT